MKVEVARCRHCMMWNKRSIVYILFMLYSDQHRIPTTTCACCLQPTVTFECYFWMLGKTVSQRLFFSCALSHKSHFPGLCFNRATEKLCPSDTFILTTAIHAVVFQVAATSHGWITIETVCSCMSFRLNQKFVRALCVAKQIIGQHQLKSPIVAIIYSMILSVYIWMLVQCMSSEV